VNSCVFCVVTYFHPFVFVYIALIFEFADIVENTVLSGRHQTTNEEASYLNTDDKQSSHDVNIDQSRSLRSIGELRDRPTSNFVNGVNPGMFSVEDVLKRTSQTIRDLDDYLKVNGELHPVKQ